MLILARSSMMGSIFIAVSDGTSVHALINIFGSNDGSPGFTYKLQHGDNN
jgi:hypothetical protein